MMENNTQIIFKNWVDMYRESLFTWAISKTKSKELSEDLVQDTFIAAFNSFDKFENKSNPKTWLITILNNKIIDYYRKSNSLVFLNFSNEDYEFIDNYNDTILEYWETEDQYKNDEMLKANVIKCLNELPLKWNLALTYKYLTNKNTSQICEELDISITNYWQIVHRAKLMLKKNVLVA